MSHFPLAATIDPTYRVFRLDVRGQVFSAEMLLAFDGAQTKTIAEALASKHGIDLWERARFIARDPHRGANE